MSLSNIFLVTKINFYLLSYGELLSSRPKKSQIKEKLTKKNFLVDCKKNKIQICHTFCFLITIKMSLLNTFLWQKFILPSREIRNLDGGVFVFDNKNYFRWCFWFWQ